MDGIRRIEFSTLRFGTITTHYGIPRPDRHGNTRSLARRRSLPPASERPAVTGPVEVTRGREWGACLVVRPAVGRGRRSSTVPQGLTEAPSLVSETGTGRRPTGSETGASRQPLRSPVGSACHVRQRDVYQWTPLHSPAGSACNGAEERFPVSAAPFTREERVSGFSVFRGRIRSLGSPRARPVRCAGRTWRRPCRSGRRGTFGNSSAPPRRSAPEGW